VGAPRSHASVIDGLAEQLQHGDSVEAAMPAPSVTLHTLGPADAALLSNLMELYIHDLSAVFPKVTLGADGRFGYPGLESYVAGQPARFAYLVRAGERTAGFVLVTRGSPASDDPTVLDIAEFFVLRQFRAQGVGRAAAVALWDRTPGTWTVRVAVRNTEAESFWRRVVTAYTKGAARESDHAHGGTPWKVFTFTAP
jgi:predicted acetyltransferase